MNKLACMNSVKRDKDGNRPSVSKKVSDVSVVVDRSGSVGSLSPHGWGEGFIQVLMEQKKISKEDAITIFITLVTFDTTATTWYNNVNVDDIPDDISAETIREMFYPRAMTRLVDTLYSALVAQNKRFTELCQNYGAQNTRSVAMVWTDGLDNQSTIATDAMLKTLIENIEKISGRSVLFLAANQDACKIGARYGVSAANCLNTGADAPSAPPMYRAATQAAARGTSGLSPAFTPAERAANARATSMPPWLNIPPGSRGAAGAQPWIPGSFAAGGGGPPPATGRRVVQSHAPPRPAHLGGGGGRGGSWGGPYNAGGRGHAGGHVVSPPPVYWAATPLPSAAAAAAALPTIHAAAAAPPAAATAPAPSPPPPSAAVEPPPLPPGSPPH